MLVWDDRHDCHGKGDGNTPQHQVVRFATTRTCGTSDTIVSATNYLVWLFLTRHPQQKSSRDSIGRTAEGHSMTSCWVSCLQCMHQICPCSSYIYRVYVYILYKSTSPSCWLQYYMLSREKENYILGSLMVKPATMFRIGIQ